MRSERAWYLRLFALLTVFVLIAAACGGDDDDDGTAEPGTEEDGGGDVPEGGELVIGAEQEPDCVAWIKSCSGSSWGYWMMGVTTMPRSFDTVPDGEGWSVEYNKDLLTGEPEVDDSNPDKPVITYSINPDAVWSDNTPITCDDYAFTWDQIANGEDIYDPTGYVDIESVECPDPNTAVVTFATPFSGWKALFGGQFGLQPKHLLEGKDIQTEMGTGYTWSGGPWKIDHWTTGVEVVLVPNENFWGTKPKLERVTFKIQADTAAEFESFNNREVAMIYPQPQPDVVDQIQAGLTDAESSYSPNTGNLEAIWMNNGVAPLDDIAVRQAIGYALDRNAIVEQLFGPLGVEAPMQTLNPPILSEFADTEAWAGYEQDLDQVDELMTGAGWAKNGDGIWAKGGQTASMRLRTTAGNARRELTTQIIEQQLREAGFDITLDYQEAGQLFGELLPQGDFELALYAQVLTAITVGQCNLFCSKNIPVAENEFSGQNWTRTNVEGLDPLLEELDKTLDEAEQSRIGKEADALQAEAMVSLPLDPLPNILIWNNTVAGDVSDNPVLGPFHNLNELGVNA
jgi:peptide/nickel transport system substrate-binding protein